MNWLREAVVDGSTRVVSSKRVAMLMATSALSVSVVMLSLAAIYGREVAAALGAVSFPLAGLGGYSYVNGKATDRAQEKAG